jgi:NitT/TauT family transport system substrate-binding protein
MKRTVAILVAGLTAGALCLPARSEISNVRVGFCARTISAVAAPFAVATRMGWFQEEGIEVELVPLSGSADCVKNIASKEIAFALADGAQLAAGRIQGLKAKIFYTAYQGNIFGMAVPSDSQIRKIADLKDKTIGLMAMGGPGLWFAKALLAQAGLDPDRSVTFVVAGEGAQTAAMVRSGQVDALSQYDAQYVMVQNAGIKLRMLETEAIERFPSNGFMALEQTLGTRRRQAVALARGYAKGTIFTLNNPEAAVRIFDQVFPAARPMGKDEATAIRESTDVLQVRIPKWRLEAGGVNRWGESSEHNYSEYLSFLFKWGVIKEIRGVQDLITNELIDEINQFDSNRVAIDARAYRFH